MKRTTFAEISYELVRKRLKDTVDSACLNKYSTAWEIKYARDLGSVRSRAATLELRPIAPEQK